LPRIGADEETLRELMEATANSKHVENAERMLDVSGVNVGPVRVAVGRTGVALGFSENAVIHLSWLALAAVFVMFRLLRRR
jgi:hypothetical protein